MVEGCIISSVVPQITNITSWQQKRSHKKKSAVLGTRSKSSGLNIMMDNPGQLGGSVADAVAGLNEYPVPFIVIDKGTANSSSSCQT